MFVYRTMEVSGNLKQQFEQLQEHQQKKLQRRKQLKEEKDKIAEQTSGTNTAVSSAFGVSDDLDLKVSFANSFNIQVLV